MRKFNAHANAKLYALLTARLMCIGCSIYEMPTIWTFKSSLIPIRGTIRSTDLHIKTVTDRKGHKSQVSELIFYLNESEKKFHLAENIGNGYVNEDHNSILRGLNRSKSVTVWIKKGELSEYEPTVFQIDKDDKHTLLEFEKVKSERRPLAAVLMIMGLSSIAFFLWMKYPEKLKKVFSD